MADSKTQELLKASKERARLAKEAEDNGNSPTGRNARVEDRVSDEAREVMKDAAEEQAELKVQARAGTLDGEVDVEAMGDVKGDGRDAKDYDDGDPDKALGVPVYEHGLKSIKAGVDETEQLRRHAGETRHSKRTEEEMSKGREVLGGRTGRTTRNTTRTDSDSDKARLAKEAKAEADAKAAEDAKAKK